MKRSEIRFLLFFFIVALIYFYILYAGEFYLEWNFSDEYLVLYVLAMMYSAYRYSWPVLAVVSVVVYGLCFTFISLFISPNKDAMLMLYTGYSIALMSSVYVYIAKLRHRESVEAKEAEQQKMLAILDNTKERIAAMDEDFNVLFMSKTLKNLWGDRVGEPCYKVFCDRHEPCEINCAVKAVIHDGLESFSYSHVVEEEVIDDDGNAQLKQIYIETYARPIEINGKRCVVEFARDVTELIDVRHELEKSKTKLEERERIYRRAIELAGGVPYVLNYQTEQYDFVGPNIENVLGYKPEEFTRDVWSECERELHLAGGLKELGEKQACLRVRSLPDSMWQAVYRMKRRDGGECWLSDCSVSFADDAGNIIGALGFLQDITEQVLQEQQRLLLQTAIDQAAESVIITDRNGVIEYGNPCFLETTGYALHELIGKTPRILKSGKHTDEFYAQMWETLAEGSSWQGTIVNRTKSGALIEEETTISPVKDSAGTTTHFVAVKRDVTKTNQLEKQLRHAQKMEAIGSLAGGIAHDFNNILMAILGYAEMVRLELSEGSKAADSQDRVIEAGNRAKDLVSQILSFSRKVEKEKSPVLIQPIVKEALKLLRASIPQTIEIHETVIENQAHVIADPTQIHQVVMNLCTNSYQAMQEKGGVLAVGFEPVELSKHQTDYLSTPIPDGRYLRFSVTDEGGGIQPELIERVFDPYFTTKRDSGGSGLGLAVVHGIVSDHDGYIDIENRYGEGLSVFVYLPVVNEKEPVKKYEENDLPSGNGERVIVIDDDVHVAKILTAYLERLNYSVDQFTDGKAALAYLENHHGDYDLILTDLTMRRITGVDIARRVMELNPDMPMIVCTGYAEEFNESALRALGVKAILQKPVLKSDLAQAASDALIKAV